MCGQLSGTGGYDRSVVRLYHRLWSSTLGHRSALDAEYERNHTRLDRGRKGTHTIGGNGAQLWKWTLVWTCVLSWCLSVTCAQRLLSVEVPVGRNLQAGQWLADLSGHHTLTLTGNTTVRYVVHRDRFLDRAASVVDLDEKTGVLKLAVSTSLPEYQAAPGEELRMRLVVVATVHWNATAPEACPLSYTILVELLFANHPPAFVENAVHGVVWGSRSPGEEVSLIFALTYRNTYALSFEEIPSGLPFRVEAQPFGTQAVLRMFTTAELDGDARPRYTFQVCAMDRFLQNAETSCVQCVIDVKETKAPTFEQANYSAEVLEDVGLGTSVLHVRVRNSHGNSVATRDVYYAIMPGSSPFRVHPESGVVFVSSALDYEAAEYHNAVVLAVDKKEPFLTGSTTLRIHVKEVNEHDPVVMAMSQEIHVDEELPPGTVLTTLSIHDADCGALDPVSLTILHLNEASQHITAVPVENTTARLLQFDLVTTAVRLDREEFPSGLVITAVAQDGGSPSRNGSLTIAVVLNDINDHAPRMVTTDWRFPVTELASVGTVICVLRASDDDIAPNNDVRFSLTRISAPGYLTLVNTVNNTASVLTQRPLDREVLPHISFEVTISDGGGSQHVSTYNMAVDVIDANDNNPVFSPADHHGHEIRLPEDTAVGTFVVQVRATDNDSGLNGDIVYSLERTTSPHLEIDPVTGVVRIRSAMDYDAGLRMVVAVIRAEDRGQLMTHHTHTWINITVENVNDNVPDIVDLDYGCLIEENTTPGQYCTQVIAVDGDEPPTNDGGSLRFLETEGDALAQHLRIDSNTGLAVTTAPIDREMFPSHVQWIRAIHVTDGPRYGSTVGFVVVHALDQNDNQPEFQPPFSATVNRFAEVGTLVITVRATDADVATNAFITYFMNSSDSSESFSVDPLSGEVRLTKGSPHTGEHFLLVGAMDAGTPTQVAYRRFVINVVSPNRAPYFRQPFYFRAIPNILPVSSEVMVLQAFDPDDDILNYTMDGSSLFAIDHTNGSITTSDTPLSVGDFTLRISAEDDGVTPLTARTVLHVRIFASSELDCDMQHLNIEIGELPPHFVFGDEISVPGATDLAVYDWTGKGQILFGIDGVSGRLMTRQRLSHRAQEWHQLLIVAKNYSDVSNASQETQCSLTVHVVRTRAVTPVVPLQLYNVPKMAPVGARVGRVWPTNIGENVTVRPARSDEIDYDMSKLEMLSVDRTSGVVRVSKPLLNFVGLIFTVWFVVESHSVDGVASTMVPVHVVPNTQSSRLSYPDGMSATVFTNATNGHFVGRFCAMANGIWCDSNIRHYIAQGNNHGLFNVRSATGVIVVTRPVAVFATAGQDIVLTMKARDFRYKAQPLVSTNITIRILASNVYKPRFQFESYSFIVPYGQPGNERLFSLNTTGDDGDGTQTAAGVLTYACSPSNTGVFTYDPSVYGVIQTGQLLPNVTEYALACWARDSEGDSYFTQKISETVTVRIRIDYSASRRWWFTSNTTELAVGETTPVGTRISIAGVLERDIGWKGTIVFYLFWSSHPGYFSIDPLTGDVIVASVLDSDKAGFSRVGIIVAARDLDRPPKSSTLNVSMAILDADDNPTIFDKALFIFDVQEIGKVGFVIGQVTTTDIDRDAESRRAQFSLVEAAHQPFSLDIVTGELRLARELDYSKKSAYDLRVQVINGGFKSTANVLVRVRHMNLFSPECRPTNVSVRVRRDMPLHTVLTTVHCVDRDGIVYNNITFSSSGDLSPLAIDSKTGSVTAVAPLVESSYTLLVTVRDSGTPARLSVVTVFVTPVSVNRFAPRFVPEVLLLTALENATKGHSLGRLTVSDSDDTSPENHVQIFASHGTGLGVIGLGTSTDQLVLLRTLDYEQHGSLSVWLTAKDSGTPPRSSSALVLLKVNDYNDNPPTFSQALYRVSVSETRPGEVCHQVVAVLTVEDRDAGINGMVEFALLGNASTNFYVEFLPPGVAVVVAKKLNREEQSRHLLQVQATNPTQPSLTSLAFIDIEVRDRFIQHVPRCIGTNNASVFSDHDIDQPVLQVFAATDLDDNGAGGRIRFSLNSSIFKVDTSTGVIRAIDGLEDITNTSVLLVVVISDEGNPSLTSTCLSTVSILALSSVARTISFPSQLNFSVQDTAPIGHLIGELGVHSVNQPYHCNILSGNERAMFFLSPNSAQLRVAGRLNRTMQDEFKLTVSCRTANRLSWQDGAVHIRVTIGQRLQFAQTRFEFIVESNAENGTTVGRVTLKNTFEDQVSFAVHATNNLDNEASTHYAIDTHTGEVILISVPASSRRLVLTVCVSEKKQPSHFDCCFVTITVTESVVRGPIFSQSSYSITVPRMTMENAVIGTIGAYNSNGLGLSSITFSIQNGLSLPFRIDTRMGKLRALGNFSKTATDHFNVTIIATNHVSNLTSSAELTVILTGDALDHPTFEKLHYIATIPENSPSNSQVVRTVATGNGGVSYQLLSPATFPFAINPLSGDILSLKPLDRESAARYRLNVQATDASGLAAFCSVTVTVLDVNDNVPHLPPSLLSVNVSERTPARSIISMLSAVDPDSGLNGTVHFSLVSIQPFNLADYFRVSHNGSVVLEKSLLELEISSVNLGVLVQDNGSPALGRNVTVAVWVADVNDNRPQLLRKAYDVELQVPLPPEVAVVRLDGSDLDISAKLDFAIAEGDPDRVFEVTSSGVVRVLRNYALNESFYSLLVEVSDGLYTTMGRVNIHTRSAFLPDISFTKTNYDIALSESIAMNSTAVTVEAQDSKTSGNALQFTILEPAESPFEIDRFSGRVSTKGLLDYEATRSYRLHIQGQDQWELYRLALTTIDIAVLDENDNKPVFAPHSPSMTVKTNHPVNSLIVQVSATDKDSSSNSKVSYEIASGNLNDLFLVNGSGVVFATESLRSFAARRFFLSIRAFDHGVPRQYSKITTVTVSVVDENLPEFSKPAISVFVLENATVGTNAGQFNASNIHGLPMEYAVEPLSNFHQYFTVHSETGTLVLQRELDFETMQSEFQVYVRAGYVYNERRYSALSSAFVTIVDVNDNAPYLTLASNSDSFVARVFENITVGTRLFRLRSTDRDTGLGGEVHFSIELRDGRAVTDPGCSLPVIDVDASESVILSKALDFERCTRYGLFVTAVDRGSPQLSSDPFPLYIGVKNVNDNPPHFLEVDLRIPERSQAGARAGRVTAIDLDGKLSTIRYSTNSSNFSIDEQSGEVVAVDIDTATQLHYPMVVTVTDGFFTVSADFPVVVYEINDFSPVFNQSRFDIAIPEKQPAGTHLVTVHATDGDDYLFGQVRYRIAAQSFSEPFGIDRQTGFVFIAKKLAFDKKHLINNMHRVIVRAEDGGGRQALAEIYVTIEDINDCSPTFSSTSVAVNLSEKIESPAFIHRLSASDCDYGSNSHIKYSIVSSSPANHPFQLLYLDQVELVGNLSSSDTYILNFQAKDQGSPPHSANFSLFVFVTRSRPPIFVQPVYEASRSEDTQWPVEIVRLHAVLDQPDAGPLIYRWDFASPQILQVRALFSLNQSSGVITLRERLRYVFGNRYEAEVVAEDRLGFTATAKFVFNVIQTERNQYEPVFLSPFLRGSIFENEQPSEIVLDSVLVAFDSDPGKNGEVDFFLQSPSSMFALTVDGRRFFANVTFDREEKAVHTIPVVARDRGNPQMTSAFPAFIELTILDLNDNPPKFTQPVYHGTVDENSDLGQSVTFDIPVLAFDPDTSSPVAYFISAGNQDMAGQSPMFHIIESPSSGRGRVTVSGHLDFEFQKNFTLTVYSTDFKFTSGESTIEIDVNDQNDHRPEFLQMSYEGEVDEGSSQLFVLQVNATDRDTDAFGPLAYSLRYLENDTTPGSFAVGRHTGIISTAVALDREQREVEVFEAYVTDLDGNGFMSDKAAIRIKVNDINDNSPVFTGAPYVFNVLENSPAPQHLAVIRATDSDVGSNATVGYQLLTINEPFTLQSVNTTSRAPAANIYLNETLDREEKELYTLLVMAFDFGTPPQNSTIEVKINVVDVNDNSPQFTQPSFNGTVSELAPAGTPVTRLQAVDGDDGTNGQLRYVLVGTDRFAVNLRMGVVTVRESGVLDFEDRQHYQFTALAGDEAPDRRWSNTTTVYIEVLDENDNAPVFTETFINGYILENQLPGQTIGQVNATDRDQGSNAQLVYFLINGTEHFYIDNVTGVITTAASFDREAMPGGVEVLVGAHDLGTPRLFAEVAKLQVEIGDLNDNAPNIELSTSDSSAVIFENDDSQTPLIGMITRDADIGRNAELNLTLNDTENFLIVNDKVVAARPFDYEKRKLYGVTVTVVDNGSPPLSATATAIVVVLDRNDNAPEGRHLSSVVNVHSSVIPETSLGCVPVFDIDTPENSIFRYEIVESLPQSTFFHMDSDSCQIFFKQALPALTDIYNIQVNISDGFGWAISTASLNVRRGMSEQTESSVTLRFKSASSSAAVTRLFGKQTTDKVSSLSQAISKKLLEERLLAASEAHVWAVSVRESSPTTVDVTLVSNVTQELLSDVIYRHRESISQQLGMQLLTVQVDDCSTKPCTQPGSYCTSKWRFLTTGTLIEVDALTYVGVDLRQEVECTCADIFAGSCSSELSDSCLSNPCLAGGTCTSTENGQDFTCRCTPDRAGDRCQILLQLPGQALCGPTSDWCQNETTITLNNTFFFLPGLRANTTSISFQMRTIENSGLLLLQSQLYGSAPWQDYVVMALVESRVHVSLSLDGMVQVLSPEKTVSDGQWHTVEIFFSYRVRFL